ncbi:CsbD family protein [Paracoccus endophyticus]|uniref:CsbD family protein n=1 Tax=Paracoccus endophyticus TaxID=2233774 RepID=UPI000DD7A8E4|nr:CsbD family protein [Paracoccus endophyticus]
MNWDIIQGKWDQLKGSVKQQWGDLTDDDLTQIQGDRDRMAGKLQERYGWAKTEVDEKMNEFFRRHV